MDADGPPKLVIPLSISRSPIRTGQLLVSQTYDKPLLSEHRPHSDTLLVHELYRVLSQNERPSLLRLLRSLVMLQT